MGHFHDRLGSVRRCRDLDISDRNQVRRCYGPVRTIDSRDEEWSDLRRINSFPGWLLRDRDSPISETHQGGSAVITIARKTGESIVISEDIILRVIEVRGDKVRLGVELPQDGTVHRAEVYEAICQMKQELGVRAIENLEGVEA
jgi:carbon storage regulator